MPTYHERGLAASIKRALQSMPVVVLTGARQVGKSTLLQQDADLRSRAYVTLDDFASLEAARQNPEALLAESESITVDEAQKSPEMLTTIKRMVDQNRAPGRFLLSGSANFSLLKGVTESLAGRAVYLTLHPFVRREIRKAIAHDPFLPAFFRSLRLPRRPAVDPVAPSEVLMGGLPPVCLERKIDRRLWFKGYEQTYLERDIRELSQVADLVMFRHLLVLAALRTGQVLNVSELARDAHLNHATATRYLGLLEASFVLHRVAPYLANRSSRLIKSPKIYLADSGLAAHLATVYSIDATADEPMRGPLFETYVTTGLASILEAHWPEATLHYWNIQGRYEVDFVIEEGRDCMALEVKAATRWGEKDLTSLRAFLAATPRCRAAVLAYNGKEAVSLGDRLWAIPLGLLLS